MPQVVIIMVVLLDYDITLCPSEDESSGKETAEYKFTPDSDDEKE